VKALIPAITVGIGFAATNPITFDSVIEPATSPVTYRPSQSSP
jgi:hypothetical protein